MIPYIFTIKRHPRLRKKFAIFKWNSEELLEKRGFKNFQAAEKAAKLKYN